MSSSSQSFRKTWRKFNHPRLHNHKLTRTTGVLRTCSRSNFCKTTSKTILRAHSLKSPRNTQGSLEINLILWVMNKGQSSTQLRRRNLMRYLHQCSKAITGANAVSDQVILSFSLMLNLQKTHPNSRTSYSMKIRSRIKYLSSLNRWLLNRKKRKQVENSQCNRQVTISSCLLR
jgi:hypothetical protein